MTNSTRKQLDVSLDEVLRLGQELSDSGVNEDASIVCGRMDRLRVAISFLKTDAEKHRDFIVSHIEARRSKVKSR